MKTRTQIVLMKLNVQRSMRRDVDGMAVRTLLMSPTQARYTSISVLQHGPKAAIDEL